MTERLDLDRISNSKTFRSFYYLKEELTDFCRKNGLPVSGGKTELTERIAYFLDTGKVLPGSVQRRKKLLVEDITLDMKIEDNFICSEKHRAFFKEHIGKGFSFNVAFQKWLKNNAGKTYAEAIEAYYQILDVMKNGKTEIGKQFEYNAYIRDFFADNQGCSLEDPIRCWNYKKRMQGHNRYEKADLKAIK